jgi:hypothetical protein
MQGNHSTTEGRHDGIGIPYVLSGARQSSGTASSNALDFSDLPHALDAAAPGDGRTPLNRYGILFATRLFAVAKQTNKTKRQNYEDN